MTPNNLSDLEKKEQSRRDHNTTVINSLVLAKEQTHRSMEHNREPRNKPTRPPTYTIC